MSYALSILFRFVHSNGSNTEMDDKKGKSTRGNLSTDTIEPEPQQRKFIFNVIRMTRSPRFSSLLPSEFGHCLSFGIYDQITNEARAVANQHTNESENKVHENIQQTNVHETVDRKNERWYN